MILFSALCEKVHWLICNQFDVLHKEEITFYWKSALVPEPIEKMNIDKLVKDFVTGDE